MKKKKISFVYSPEPAMVVSEDYKIEPEGFDMRTSIAAVEAMLGYRFRNPMLLEEALTHSSFTDSVSYERLEFTGDAAFNLAFGNYFFLAYPNLDPGSMSVLRAANVSTERFARVAVRHGLYRYIRRNAPILDMKVKEFTESIREDEGVEVVEAPKVLADIVESIAGAVYVDCDFDLKLLWTVFRGLLEPIVTPETLRSNPLTELHELCQKLGKPLEFRHKRKGNKEFACVYIGRKLFGTGCSEKKAMAKLSAAKDALLKFGRGPSKVEREGCASPLDLGEVAREKGEANSKQKLSVCSSKRPLPQPLNWEPDGCASPMEHEVVKEKEEIYYSKHKLSVYCSKRHFPQPSYRVEREAGPSHAKIFMCSAQVETPNGRIIRCGGERARVKDAENLAASLMLSHLKSLDDHKGGRIFLRRLPPHPPKC